MADLHGARRSAAEEIVPELAAQPPFGSSRSAASRSEAASAASAPSDGDSSWSILARIDLRKHRRGAFGADRHADRRAVDDRRREEIAKLRPVDGVDRNAERARVVRDAAVERLVAGRGEHHHGAGEQGRVVVGLDMRRAASAIQAASSGAGSVATTLIARARLAEEPRLGERLVAAADDDDDAPFDPHEDGEGIELGGRLRHADGLLECARRF